MARRRVDKPKPGPSTAHKMKVKRPGGRRGRPNKYLSRKRKSSGRKGKALSAAHKKAISEGLKRFHRGKGKKKTTTRKRRSRK